MALGLTKKVIRTALAGGWGRALGKSELPPGRFGYLFFGSKSRFAAASLIVCAKAENTGEMARYEAPTRLPSNALYKGFFKNFMAVAL
jgi:hypothetical protein